MLVCKCSEIVKEEKPVDEYNISGDKLKNCASGIYKRKSNSSVDYVIVIDKNTLLFYYPNHNILDTANGVLTSGEKFKPLPKAKLCFEVRE